MQGFYEHRLALGADAQPLLRVGALLSEWRLLDCCDYVALGGGGMHGLMYIGALMALTHYDDGAYRQWRARLRGVAGTSAGALVGTMIAAGLTPAEMRGIVHRMDFAKVLRTALDLSLPDMLAHRAVSSGTSADAVLTAFVTAVCGGVATMTLCEFAAHCGGVELAVMVTNMRTGCGETWSARTKPHVLLLHALRCTVAVPGMLPPYVVDGDEFLDGGVVCNLPLHVYPPARTLILLTHSAAPAPPPSGGAAPPPSLLTMAGSLVVMMFTAAQLGPARTIPHTVWTMVPCVARSHATAAALAGLRFSANPATLDALMEDGAVAAVSLVLRNVLLLGLVVLGILRRAQRRE
jgi:NTE family protein